MFLLKEAFLGFVNLAVTSIGVSKFLHGCEQLADGDELGGGLGEALSEIGGSMDRSEFNNL